MSLSDPSGAPRALTQVADLVADGLAGPGDAPLLEQVTGTFRLRISPEMRGAAAAHEGVARQFVPSAAELLIRAEERTDPIGDRAHSPAPGLTHRYPDRVILQLTQTCDVYCRFCFRRETVGQDGQLPDAALDEALAYIARTPQIFEVILTGGDPLTLSPRRLADLLARLAAIGHLGVVRFHSRVPVVAPARISPALIAALTGVPLAVYVVVHTNHPGELTPAALAALGRLTAAGLPLLSQTVLLKGVNDRVEVLATLFRALVRAKVKPYYLHHCDLARGTSHFRTTVAAGQRLVEALRAEVSGLCMPTYVLDIPGGFGKVPLAAAMIAPKAGAAPGHHQVRDRLGGTHDYRDPLPDPETG